MTADACAYPGKHQQDSQH
jgi:hypothetical protein